MTLDDALNILPGEQVEVDSSVFAASPQPSGVWIRCDVRFLTNKRGIGGWADIAGDRIYVICPTSGDGLYAHIGLVRRPTQP